MDGALSEKDASTGLPSGIDVFDAATAEAFAQVFDEGDIEDSSLVSGFLQTLTLICDDEATGPWIDRHLVPVFSKAIRRDDDLVLNPAWTDRATFAPLHAALARRYYETARPQSYPTMPPPVLAPTARSMFGVELRDVLLPLPERHPERAVHLFAGCCAVAVIQSFAAPITLALGYVLATRSCNDGDEATK